MHYVSSYVIIHSSRHKCNYKPREKRNSIPFKLGSYCIIPLGHKTKMQNLMMVIDNRSGMEPAITIGDENK